MKFLRWSFTESKFEFWNGEILRGFLRRLDPLKELDMAENEPMLRSWNLALPYFTVIWAMKYTTLAGWRTFGPSFDPSGLLDAHNTPSSEIVLRVKKQKEIQITIAKIT